MATTTECSASLEQLRAMIGDLHANHVTLDDLSLRCSMFHFTGGTMSLAGWQIAGLTPPRLAGSSLGGAHVPEDIDRYLALLDKLAAAQQDVAKGTRPRSLRARRVITEALDPTLSEARRLGASLERSLRRCLELSESVGPQRTPGLFGKAVQ